MTHEFTTAISDAYDEEADQQQTFTLDGEEFGYYQPTDGQIMMFLASLGKRSTISDNVAGLVDFFFGMFDDEDQIVFSRRLMDRKDPFDHRVITEIMETMMEDWTGRPTKLSSASPQSRRSGGQKSTPRTRKSTSSVSQSTDS